MGFDGSPLEPDFQEASRLFVTPAGSRRKLGYLVLSLVIFSAVWVARGSASYLDLALIVGVILLHEAGHAIAMQLSGYRDVRIFFIPLLGAATSGRASGVARWKQAIVLLAGPLPGLVAGYALRHVAEPGWTMHAAAILIVINAINLLPVEPLDGGQLFQVLVYARNRHLELSFRALTAAVVVGASLYLHQWALALAGFLVLLSWRHAARVLSAADKLKDKGLPESPAQLDEAQLRLLHTTAWNALPQQWKDKWRFEPQPQANLMDQVHQRAVLRAPSWGATAAVLAIWSCGMALALAAVLPILQPTLKWKVYRGTGFTVELPERARLMTESPTYLSFADDHSTFGIHQETVHPGSEYVKRIEAKLSSSARPDRLPHEFLREFKGHTMRLRVIGPGIGNVGYILQVWPDDLIGQKFLASFRTTR